MKRRLTCRVRFNLTLNTETVCVWRINLKKIGKNKIATETTRTNYGTTNLVIQIKLHSDRILCREMRENTTSLLRKPINDMYNHPEFY